MVTFWYASLIMLLTHTSLCFLTCTAWNPPIKRQIRLSQIAFLWQSSSMWPAKRWTGNFEAAFSPEFPFDEAGCRPIGLNSRLAALASVSFHAGTQDDKVTLTRTSGVRLGGSHIQILSWQLLKRSTFLLGGLVETFFLFSLFLSYAFS